MVLFSREVFEVGSGGLVFHGDADGAVTGGQCVVGGDEQVTNVMVMQVGVGVEVFEHGLVADCRDGEFFGLGKYGDLGAELGGEVYCYGFGSAEWLDRFHGWAPCEWFDTVSDTKYIIT